MDKLQVPAHHYGGLRIGRSTIWVSKIILKVLGLLLLFTLKLSLWAFVTIAKVAAAATVGVLYIFLATCLGAVGGLKMSKK